MERRVLMFEIQSGAQKKARKVVVYGPEGIGKSTFASQFPNPLFIDTEDSTTDMDVKRLKNPTSWSELIQMLDWVKQTKPCSTIIIDTADWAQTLAERAVCSEKGVTSIEDIGYGKGYVFMRDKFGNLLDKLTEIKEAGINTVLTAHSQIKKFEDPAELGAYDRYELKLAEKANASIAGVVKEWADMVLFLNYKVISVKASDMGDKYKAQGGKRVIHTTHHPAWDAKNRYGLPDELPLDYSAIAHVIPDMNQAATVTQSTPKEEPKTDNSGFEVNDNPPSKRDQKIVNDSINSIPPEYLPKAITDLMSANGVTEDELKGVAAIRGHFPINTDFSVISKESPDYFTGGLVPNWDGVLQIVRSIRDDPKQLLSYWEKVGGNEQSLQNMTIKKGDEK